MNIVYAFIGPLPSYSIDTVHQARLFFDGPIYFIVSDTSSPFVDTLKSKYNVTVVPYESVVDDGFNSLVEANKHRFCIAYKLKGRERIFIYSFERFYILHNLMIKENLTDVFFMELDNVIYEDPRVWVESFRVKDIAYMFDNVNRASSGIAYIKNTDILRTFTNFSSNFIMSHNGFIDEMSCLYKFWEENKNAVQFLPTHWVDTNCTSTTHENYHLYNNTIFDAAAVGIYLGGVDPYHITVTGSYNKLLGNKSIWGLIDYTHYQYKWELDSEGRNIPYVYSGHNWLKINNLHIHSKELTPVLSKQIT